MRPTRIKNLAEKFLDRAMTEAMLTDQHTLKVEENKFDKPC